MPSKVIIKELRIIKRIIGETVKGLLSTGWINLAIIGTMAAILSIFACMLRTTLGISAFVDNLGNALEVSVYLKSNANVETVAKNIRQIENVKDIHIITKEQAWNNLRREMEVPNISNPLPDTMHVKVSEQKYINDVISQLKSINGIESVRYAQDVAEKMSKINEASHMATIIAMFFIGGLTVFIINNTIYLVIQSRSQEIEIMRMMGVANWYIKAPYVLQGAFYGFISAFIALIPLNLLQMYISNLDSVFQLSISPVMINAIVLFIMFIGIFLGITGSLISMKKYLKV
ncbi:MAG: permease-like cell division protein FtsX [Candidatus Gastranaerophilales bacterium]|nr:permease-like cell division protein FtsX [Candidatus Gastranaerophilales bacterium]